MIRNVCNRVTSSFSRQSNLRATQSIRNLDLQEYRSKELCARHKVRVQRGIVADTAEETVAAAEKLRADGCRDIIVKSQILAGGRGKGTFDTGFKGGVKICDSPQEAGEMAGKMTG